MRFFSTLVAASVVVTSVLAAPFAGPDDITAIDSSGLVPYNFTTSDGTTHEIWVDSSFLSGAELEKREKTGFAYPPAPASRYPPKWEGKDTHQNKCRHSSFNGDTGPHAPTTGRCKAIKAWADSHKGLFSIGWQAITTGQYKALLYSSNDGATTCLFGVYHTAWKVRIGNTDISDLIRDSLNKYTRSYNGVYRVRAWGYADCDGDLVQNGSAELRWKLTEKM
ncbi:hypothetical protein TWF718_005208 [Orbilia javanica]|uniref:Ecp2 effector protein-like domain-containing protein n=1 Tax=Orbilia javanica TaxID=47235 RepID=A0AAN8RLM2_9PEZI